MRIKRLVSFFLVSIIIAVSFSFNASAVTKADLYNELKGSIFDKYAPIYGVSIENSLRNISISDAQAEQILVLIKEVKAYVNVDKGHSLHFYTDAEKNFVLDRVDKACKILDLTYKVIPKPLADDEHVGDIIFVFYDASGKKIFEFDGDIIKKTNVPTTQTTNNIVYLSGLLMLFAASVLIYKKCIHN